MRNIKWLMVPILAVLVAPMLSGCMVEERYPYGYYHGYYHRPYYERHYRPVRRGIVIVGQNDAQPPDAVIAENPSPTTTE